MGVPEDGFDFTPTDTDDGILVDPDSPVAGPNVYRTARNVISTVAGVLAVTYKSGRDAIVPVVVGSNPMQVTHIKATGTTAGITSAGVHVQF